jgi:hypothetical protein
VLPPWRRLAACRLPDVGRFGEPRVAREALARNRGLLQDRNHERQELSQLERSSDRWIGVGSARRLSGQGARQQAANRSLDGYPLDERSARKPTRWEARLPEPSCSTRSSPAWRGSTHCRSPILRVRGGGAASRAKAASTIAGLENESPAHSVEPEPGCALSGRPRLPPASRTTPRSAGAEIGSPLGSRAGAP